MGAATHGDGTVDGNTLDVVFSFRNEQDVLPELIRRTRAALREEQQKGVLAGFKMIFVNDASTDRSLEVLLDHAEGHNDICIINMSARFGVSPCVIAGMEYSCAEAVVYMDADLQDPPEVIPELLRAWREGENVEVVNTVRLSRAGESKLKLMLTRIGYLALHKTSSIRLPMEAGDFKLLSRKAVEQVLQLKEKKPFLRGLICWIGFKQARVEYNREARFSGATKFPVTSLPVIANFLESALISFSAFPLQISTLAGCFCWLAGMLLTVCGFVQLVAGAGFPWWTAMMAAMFVLGGIQLICMGVLGLYLSTIYQESKGRPNYIVESTFGFPVSPNVEGRPAS